MGFTVLSKSCAILYLMKMRNAKKIGSKHRVLQSIGSVFMLLFVFLSVFGFAACSSEGALVISEVCSSNKGSLLDGEYGTPDWIELYNGTSTDISLDAWSITDNAKAGDKYHQLPNVIIPAGEYFILYACKSDVIWEPGMPVCTGFALSVNGESIALVNDRNIMVAELDIPKLDTDVSYVRRADGSYGFSILPTPGKVNGTTLYSSLDDAQNALTQGVSTLPSGMSAVVISEVCAKNNASLHASCCLQPDWIELHNLSDTDLSLAGFTLCDDLQDWDKKNLQNAIIEADGYLLVRGCDVDCDQSDGHICVRLGVSSNGETLYLYDASNRVVDSVEVPALSADISWARREDGSFGYCTAPTPGEANTTNISESPLPTEMDSNAPIRVSELLPKNKYGLTDSDGDKSDWVELIIKTPGASLAGYYLSDDADDLQKWQIPTDAAFDENGFLLIFLSGKNRTDGVLHANFSLSAGETFYLFHAASGTMDSFLIPELRSDVSLGKDEGGNIVYFGYPTPLGKNTESLEADQVGFFTKEGIFVSEVSVVQANGTKAADWIEIYNGTGADINLAGFSLSDDADNWSQWILKDTPVAANAYVVLYTSGHASRGEGNFGLSNGETVFLRSSEGYLVDSFAVGTQRYGMSSGRVETNNQIARAFFDTPTPGGVNSNNYTLGYVSAPVLSDMDLYHDEAFTVSITCADSTATLYYTLDGSVPNEKSKVYIEPLHIEKNTVLRVAAFEAGLESSAVSTAHYLFETPHTIPVVCLAMSADDFTAVYRVSMYQDRKTRTGSFSYYETDGARRILSDADLIAKGRGTLKFSQKSLAVHFRGQVERGTVEYPIFTDYAVTSFSSLVLRSGGQDLVSARIRDSYASRAVQGMYIDGAMTRPVALYVNGAYHGLSDLGEDLNAGWLETHYGVDTDNVELIRRNTFAMRGSDKDMKELRDWVNKTNFADDAKFEQLAARIDVDYFTDYFIAQTYMSNSDMFNQKYWRTTDGTLKWRPVFYDLDFCFDNSVERSILSSYFNPAGVPSANGTLTDMNLYVALWQNEGWRNRCAERYVEVVCTYFNAERMTTLLDEMAAELRPEMSRQIERWKYIGNVKNWETHIATLREKVASRPEIALKQMQKYFKISDAQMEAWLQKYGGLGG